jgi:hypothetical protein
MRKRSKSEIVGVGAGLAMLFGGGAATVSGYEEYHPYKGIIACESNHPLQNDCAKLTPPQEQAASAGEGKAIMGSILMASGLLVTVAAGFAKPGENTVREPVESPALAATPAVPLYGEPHIIVQTIPEAI